MNGIWIAGWCGVIESFQCRFLILETVVNNLFFKPQFSDCCWYVEIHFYHLMINTMYNIQYMASLATETFIKLLVLTDFYTFN